MNEEMAYNVRDLDPKIEITPQRRWIEFGIVFAITFLLVRFGGWHHHMDPLSDAYNVSSLISFIAAAGVSGLFMLWRNWSASTSN